MIYKETKLTFNGEIYNFREIKENKFSEFKTHGDTRCC